MTRTEVHRENGNLGCRPFSFHALYSFPSRLEERCRRDFLTCADWPSHYVSPEFFLDPSGAGRRPFAVFAVYGECSPQFFRRMGGVVPVYRTD